jgi:hypothetical protein
MIASRTRKGREGRAKRLKTRRTLTKVARLMKTDAARGRTKVLIAETSVTTTR